VLSQKSLTRDEALLVLNDHLGQEVEVTLDSEIGDTTRSVMSATGVLRHWRDDPGAATQTWAREDLTGLYDVGDASFDVTHLDLADLDRPPGRAGLLTDGDEPPYGLAFDLGDGVALKVVWGVEPG
jgi:hypothetical protein